MLFLGDTMTAPTIMVSSTFYDLHQIRTDLYIFISNDLGYIPLLSELPSFPVDPDIDTIENCRKRVKEDADIMVLVIGGRYGSIDSNSLKSITNLEFLAARAKGIPIYVFIDKSVLNILPLWKANPEGNFSSVVDTTKVFEFIEKVRNEEHVWTFEFERAQDIISVLRIQFSHLFYDSLKGKQLLIGSGMPHYMELLQPKSLRLAFEKPDAWEYKLFFQIWLDEVEQHADMIREYKEKLQLETAIYVPAIEAPEWFQTQIHELSGYVDSANHLMNDYIAIAFGAPGQPGDPEKIVWVSHMIGRILDQTIKWANRIRCGRYEPPFNQVAPEAALFADDIISQFESFPSKSLSLIEETLLLPKLSEPRTLEFTLVLTLSNQEKFDEVISDIRLQYGL
jgi:hypothetical protein